MPSASPVHPLRPQRWAWRLRPSPPPPPSSSPSLHVSATSHGPCLALRATLRAPLPHAHRLRLRLQHELALRRDTARRRSRLPPQPFAAPLRLNTGVGRAGVVADRTLLDVKLEPHHGRAAARLFEVRCHPPGAASWTWAAAEGDRLKIWFLDVRFRVVADLVDDTGQVKMSARNFCVLTARAPGDPHPQPTTPAHQPAPTLPMHAPSRRDGIVLDRAPHALSAPLLSLRQPRDRTLRAESSARLTLRRAGPARAEPPAAPPARPRKRSVLPGRPRGRGAGAPAGCAAEAAGNALCRVDDVELTVVLQNGVHCVPLRGELGVLVRARLMSGAWARVRVGVVLTEKVEVVDDMGATQVVLLHRHRMRVTRLRAGAGAELMCEAMLPMSPDVFYADARFGECMRVSHAVHTVVRYERRRGLSLRGAAAQPVAMDAGCADAARELWEGAAGGVRGANEREVKHVVAVRVVADKWGGESGRADARLDVPSLAVWGSVGRVPAVGTSECRRAREAPEWVGRVWADEGGEAAGEGGAGEAEGECVDGMCAGSAIDMLRALAYAKGGGRAEGEGDGSSGELLLRRFPTVTVDGGGLAEQSCPVCLERLGGAGVVLLPCLHAGHGGCLRRAECERLVCPVCRLDLRPFLKVGGGAVAA